MAVEGKQRILPEAVEAGVAELAALVRQKYPQSRFGKPAYLPEEDVWVVETYLPDDEDFELLDALAETETSILLEHGACIVMLTLPL